MRNTKRWMAAGVPVLMLVGCSVSGGQPERTNSTGQSDNPATTTAPASSAYAPQPDAQQAQHSILTYSQEGMTQREPATFVHSAQGYDMYVIDKFAFSAEEPGNDIVALKSNREHYWVRVEKLGDTVGLDQLAAEAEQTLQAIGQPVRDTPSQSLSDPFMREHAVMLYHAAGNGAQVHLYVLRIDGVSFRFTVFQPAESEDTAPVLAMISTVKAAAEH